MDKRLQWMLNDLEGFRNPKIKLEQYATSAELAVSMMDMINEEVGINGSMVADLGCGCGMLMTTIAVAYEPSMVIGIDIDTEALKICEKNLETAEVRENCDLINADVLNSQKLFNSEMFDIIVINPPFGTKNNEGIDINFVKSGISMLKEGGSVFSLHKSTTRDFILKSARKWEDVEAEAIAKMRWRLEATYKFHKKKAVDIEVDLIKFSKKSST